MVTRAHRRALTVPAIVRLTRTRDFRTLFAEVGAEPREQTIIPALVDDSLGYVFDRLKESGGSAILAVLSPDGGFTIAALLPASPARMAVAAEDDSVVEVHAASTVGIFLDYLARSGGTAVFKQVAAKIVDQGPLQLT